MTASRGDGEAPAGVPFDAAGCIERLAKGTADAVRGLGRRGAVVAVSGGVNEDRVHTIPTLLETRAADARAMGGEARATWLDWFSEGASFHRTVSAR